MVAMIGVIVTTWLFLIISVRHMSMAHRDLLLLVASVKGIAQLIFILSLFFVRIRPLQGLIYGLAVSLLILQWWPTLHVYLTEDLGLSPQIGIVAGMLPEWIFVALNVKMISFLRVQRMKTDHVIQFKTH